MNRIVSKNKLNQITPLLKNFLKFRIKSRLFPLAHKILHTLFGYQFNIIFQISPHSLHLPVTLAFFLFLKCAKKVSVSVSLHSLFLQPGILLFRLSMFNFQSNFTSPESLSLPYLTYVSQTLTIYLPWKKEPCLCRLLLRIVLGI